MRRRSITRLADCNALVADGCTLHAYHQEKLSDAFVALPKPWHAECFLKAHHGRSAHTGHGGGCGTSVLGQPSSSTTVARGSLGGARRRRRPRLDGVVRPWRGKS